MAESGPLRTQQLKPPLAKTVKELLGSGATPRQLGGKICEALAGTPFLQQLEATSRITGNPAILTAICDYLKFEAFSSRQDILGDQEDPADWLVLVLEGRVEGWQVAVRLADKNSSKSNSELNHLLSKKTSKEHKRSILEEDRVSTRRSPYLLSYMEHDLEDRRMYCKVDKYITQNKLKKEKFQQKKARINSEYLVKRLKLEKKPNLRKKDYFFEMVAQKKDSGVSREDSGGSANLKRGLTAALRTGTVTKEVRTWVVGNRFGEGDAIGSLFSEDPDQVFGKLTAEPGTFVATIRKSQVFKILANFNQSSGLKVKSVFLTNLNFDFGSASNWNKDFLFSSFRVN